MPSLGRFRTGLLRKLLTSDFRNTPTDANAEAAVLVIGEPKIGSPEYPPLPGARDEAKAVAQQFRSGPYALRDSQVEELTDAPEFDALMIALMARPYRVVHVAGHGAPQTSDSRGGVVLSEGIFLGPDEIRKLPVVPELVFVNCCHLGGFDTSRTLKISAPATFAAGVAESLISIGVRSSSPLAGRSTTGQRRSSPRSSIELFFAAGRSWKPLSKHARRLEPLNRAARPGPHTVLWRPELAL